MSGRCFGASGQAQTPFITWPHPGCSTQPPPALAGVIGLLELVHPATFKAGRLVDLQLEGNETLETSVEEEHVRLDAAWPDGFEPLDAPRFRPYQPNASTEALQPTG